MKKIEYLLSMLNENNEKDFIKKNLGKGLAIKKKGRFGIYHWEISSEKGDYQKINRITSDTEEGALKQYYKKYILKK